MLGRCKGVRHDRQTLSCAPSPKINLRKLILCISMNKNSVFIILDLVCVIEENNLHRHGSTLHTECVPKVMCIRIWDCTFCTFSLASVETSFFRSVFSIRKYVDWSHCQLHYTHTSHLYMIPGVVGSILQRSKWEHTFIPYSPFSVFRQLLYSVLHNLSFLIHSVFCGPNFCCSR
jgi:hypothetical protein